MNKYKNIFARKSIKLERENNIIYNVCFFLSSISPTSLIILRLVFDVNKIKTNFKLFPDYTNK